MSSPFISDWFTLNWPDRYVSEEKMISEAGNLQQANKSMKVSVEIPVPS